MTRKFENIIIASDMDGTFLTNCEAGKKRNREKIEYFKEQGGHFTFSTGRSYKQILNEVPDAAELVNMPAVTCNGASLYDFATQTELEYYPVAYETIVELEAFLNSQPDPIGLRGGSSTTFLYNQLNNPYIREDYALLSSRYILPVSQWESYGINKLAVRAEADVLARIRPALTERFHGRLEVTQSDPTLIDVQSAGRTKAVLLGALVKNYFDRPMYLCVVGDYDNDLEMLALADLPCCPSNAVDCVKAAAKHCFCSNHEGVIADLV
ncbi:MAG: HAD hydrolase family protein, partial [Clostridia bacterium]|nr:HAD hydrolase family protein [Clostridia bacterium]